MPISAPLMIATGTPLLRRGEPDLAAASTIHSIFFARFLVGAVAGFSKAFLLAAELAALMNGSAVPTCVATCRSPWKKQPLERKEKWRYANSTSAINDRARAPSRARVRSTARPAAVAGR